MNGYRCPFIDWHGTLSASRFWGQLAAGTPTERRCYARMRDALYGPLARLIVPWMRGMLTTEDVMRAVAEETGLPYSGVLAAFIVGCRQMALVSPQIAPLVAALRHRCCRVVIATDNMDCFLRWTAPRLRLTEAFDDILCSATLGVLKNERSDSSRSAFFGPSLARYGLGPGEVALLDDSATIAATIQGFGIDYWPITPQRDLMMALEQLLAAVPSADSTPRPGAS